MEREYKVVLFDLDGTLLPMDMEAFIRAYFAGISARLARHGHDPKTLIQGIWMGTAAMQNNDGTKKNETVFWEHAVACCGQKIKDDEECFNAFYVEDFDKVQASCGYREEAAAIVRDLKAAGKRVALATNPIFPAIATQKRIRWAGLSHEEFELVTTYENSRYCKPNLQYYRDILKELGVDATDCVMVGNDVNEDMVAANLGMQVFLLTDCLLNKDEKDISVYPHGDFAALRKFLFEK